MASSSVLLIDNDSLVLQSFQNLLQKQGFVVDVAHQSIPIFQMLKDKDISTVIVSLEWLDSKKCPDADQENVMDPYVLIHEIVKQHMGLSILVTTTNPSAKMTAKALDCGAQDYFVLPIQDWKRFYHVLTQNETLWQERVELKKLRDHRLKIQEFREIHHLDGIKGNSRAIRDLLDAIESIAPLNLPTLIIGESGVGKEIVAKAVHAEFQRSHPHREGLFVPVNCAAISAELFEAELFGHAKGAFTGAAAKRQGLCALAAGGTLFLDEIGELSLAMQPKLLRLLEQREYRPVGSDHVVSFKGRIVTATNVNLEEAVQNGTFREDLYYRLSTQELYIPPLRDRPEDIVLLALHFIEESNEVCQRNIKSIAPEARKVLEAYDWHRNNVRELKREIQRAMVRMRPEDTELLPSAIFWEKGYQKIPQNIAQKEQHEGWLDLPYSQAMSTQRLRHLERYLLYHYEKSGRNKSQAAVQCGIKSSNFFRLWKEVGLDTAK